MRVQVYFTKAGSSSIFLIFFFENSIFHLFLSSLSSGMNAKVKKINAVTVYISFRLRQTSQQGVSIIYTDL